MFVFYIQYFALLFTALYFLQMFLSQEYDFCLMALCWPLVDCETLQSNMYYYSVCSYTFSWTECDMDIMLEHKRMSFHMKYWVQSHLVPNEGSEVDQIAVGQYKTIKEIKWYYMHF